MLWGDNVETGSWDTEEIHVKITPLPSDKTQDGLTSSSLVVDDLNLNFQAFVERVMALST